MPLNVAVFHGFMVKDPQVKKSRTGYKLVGGTIAVDRDYISGIDGERPTDYIDFFAWNHVADNLLKWFPKGKACILVGRMESYDVENTDGRKVRKTRLNVLRCYFAGRKTDPPNTEEVAPYEPPSYFYQPTFMTGLFDEVDPPEGGRTE